VFDAGIREMATYRHAIVRAHARQVAERIALALARAVKVVYALVAGVAVSVARVLLTWVRQHLIKGAVSTR
jgi:hypothetical protein